MKVQSGSPSFARILVPHEGGGNPFQEWAMRTKKTTKTVELTVARSESFVVPKPFGQTFVWCEECHRRGAFVTPPEASRASGVSLRTLFRRIELAEVHFVEMPGAGLLICLESLLRFS